MYVLFNVCGTIIHYSSSKKVLTLSVVVTGVTKIIK